MKKLLICLLALAIMTCLFCACTDFQNPSATTTGVMTPTKTDVSNGGVGGEDWDFSRSYSFDFTISDFVSEFVDPKLFQSWCNQFEHFGAGGTRNKYEYNYYEFITEFALSRQTLEKICAQYNVLFPEIDLLTDEQVDMLYTGTEVEVYRYFANPYAVLVGKDAYSPKWMVEHTAEEYAAKGITYAIMSEKMDKMLSVCNEKQQDHLRTQLEALKALEK